MTTYDPAASGCTSCGTQDTVLLDPRHGRRCAQHPPPFDRACALLLVDLGRPSEAFSLLRSWLAYRAWAS